MVDSLVASSPMGKSDHVVLTWDFLHANGAREEKDMQPMRYDFRKGDYADTSKKLCEMNWGEMEHMDVEETWKSIREEIEELVHEHIPQVRRTNQQKTQSTMVA